ncbi:hypothetical protein CFC21_015898 [Triticum aestivum]|nr:hypothetical protein CFC21_015898 [Triticum aestivum]VAH27677.1 unnamed protein product [Triticum turgidum subsp. durum]
MRGMERLSRRQGFTPSRHRAAAPLRRREPRRRPAAPPRRQVHLLQRPVLQLRRVVPDANDPGSGAGGPLEGPLLPQLI